MDNKAIFTPVRGQDKAIQALPYQEGAIYFALDTRKMYLDAKGENKIPIGGESGGSSGSGIIFGNKVITVEEESQDIISFTLNQLNISYMPAKDAVILNTTDGCFYRVIVSNSDQDIQAIRLTVAGNGSSSGSGAKIEISILDGAKTGDTFVYGQASNLVFKGSVDNGDPVMTYLIKIINEYAGEKTEKTYGPYTHATGENYIFELGTKLKLGTNNVQIVATSDNAGFNKTHSINLLNCVEMYLQASEDFNPLKFSNGKFNFYCIPVGENLNKTVDIYIDDELKPELRKTDITATSSQISFEIPALSHGMHTLKAVLTCEESAATTELIYNICAVTTGENSPIIWYNSNTPTSIIDHDKLTIEYMVYNPLSTLGVETHYYINGAEIATSPMNVDYSKSGWLKWRIIGYEVGTNVFTIKVGTTECSIMINVEKDTKRNLDIVTSGLFVNLNAAGRSNNENIQSRQTWTSTSEDGTVTAVKFNNFNWYNNGWINDDDGETCLRISNGASIEIPLNVMDRKKLQNSLAFEFVFKVRNVQNYSTLINTIVDNPESENPTIRKEVSSTDGVWGNYYNANIGFCLGTQEAFFKSKNSLVSGRYKEDDLVHVSFVIEAEGANSNANKLMYIYINGVNSGIAKYNLDTDTLASNCKTLKINSNYCDIDLYKFRVYKINLTSQYVVQNYLADYNDADLYDMNAEIVDYTNGIPSINYLKMVEYNRTHPDAPLMPYMVVETTNSDDVLPYKKMEGDAWSVNIEFVNPTLDYEYENNIWTNEDILSRGYKSKDEMYFCSAPSYKATGVDFNVQGTSSQGYPIRNYKAKFKSAKDKWVYTAPWAVTSSGQQINLKDGGVTASGYKVGKKFHMDSPIGENKTTLKADFMDSSRAHNTGFASFVGTLYSKHPLDDYDNFPGSTEGLRTSLYGFPILMFQKKHDGTYKFLGCYNYNLDKGSDDTLGFRDWGEDSYVDVTAKVNVNNFDNKKLYIKNDNDFVKLDSTAVYSNTETYYRLDEAGDSNALNPDYDPTDPYSREYLPWSQAAECWEFANNQDGRCSMKKASFNEVDQDGKLTVINDFEYRYHYDADSFDNAYAGVNMVVKADGQVFPTQEDLNNFVVKKMSRWESFIEWIMSTDYTTAPNTPLPAPVTYGQNTYEIDSPEYRKAKFVHEFDLHLDKEYCLIYYIMTELLICYDSRGKNLMMGTWGPKERGGFDIWYPMFYDIDTQLGVNNSGVPYWDYYEEASKNNTFSTPNSVLWVNLWECCKEEIKSKYNELTGVKLTINNLDGYYRFDPEVSKSRAMAGHRPMILKNVDQYQKYIAPSITGYTDTAGTSGIITDTFYYCLQGDRELQRALLLRNRFNFISSAWQGGPYSKTGVMQGIGTRYNANVIKETSDKYLVNPTAKDLELGYEKAEYPHPLDFQYDYEVTPFLKQYISCWYDESKTGTQYAEGGQTIKAPILDSIKDAALNTANVTQQIVKWGGAEYMSSLGDLSTKYLNELWLSSAKRLKDLIVGNDTDGYYNNLLKTDSFKPDDSATAIVQNPDGTSKVIANPNAKSLLEKIVLTNLPSLDGTYDFSGSEKLKELRALNTNISSFILADGVQISKLHLPATITNLILKEPTSLTGILSDASPSKETVVSYNPIAVTAETYDKSVYYINTLDGYKRCDDAEYFGYYYEEVEDVTADNFSDYTELFVYNKTNDVYELVVEFTPATTYFTKHEGQPFNATRNYYIKDVKETLVYPDGLFIEGLTNLAEITADSKTQLGTINIVGGNMGYDSYSLLNKTTLIKQQMINNSELDTGKFDKHLAINIEGVQWTPYRLVEIGEVAEEGKAYKLLNDHDEFIDYSKVSGEYPQWTLNVLNEKVYELNTELLATQNNTITDLSVLDTYINDYRAAKEIYDSLENKNNFEADNYNFFTSIDSNVQGPTLAKLTGTIFINNSADNPIEESLIKNYYHDTYYPKLNIQVANITKGNVAKFVEVVDEETGKEYVWDTLKYAVDGQAYPDISSKTGSKLNYDFIGWADKFYPQAELDAMEPADVEALCIQDFSQYKFADTENGVVKFYAIYTIHSYVFTFNYSNGTLIDSIKVPAGSYVSTPSIIPYKDDSDLDFDKTWKFAGYARTPNAMVSEIIGLKADDGTKLNMISNADVTLYAIFDDEPISVYKNVHPEYFTAAPITWSGVEGVVLSLIAAPKGKLTIPYSFENKPVFMVDSTFGGSHDENLNGFGKDLTHIFFEKQNGVANIKAFGEKAFYNTCKLLYIDYPEGLEEIQNEALSLVADSKLTTNFYASVITPSSLKVIGREAFRYRFGPEVKVIEIGGNVSSIGYLAFARYSKIEDNLEYIYIGDEDNKSSLVLLTADGKVPIVSQFNKYQLIMYAASEPDSDTLNKNFPTATNIQIL